MKKIASQIFQIHLFLWDLIFLRKFGYRNKFIYMIQVASINIQTKIKINGLLIESFTLIQGFHQGCPLSMLLYALLRLRHLQFSLMPMQRLKVYR